MVEKPSALLTPPGQLLTFETQCPVAADHRDMCRFASRDDETYLRALRSIKRLYKGQEILSRGNEFFLVPDAVNPQFTGRVEMRQSLDDCLVSCRRVGVQQRVVLHGLGGSGKTQLALKFASDHRQK